MSPDVLIAGEQLGGIVKDPDHSGHALCLGAADHIRHRLNSNRGMLRVQDDKIEACDPQDLYYLRTRCCDKSAELDLALLQIFF